MRKSKLVLNLRKITFEAHKLFASPLKWCSRVRSFRPLVSSEFSFIIFIHHFHIRYIHIHLINARYRVTPVGSQFPIPYAYTISGKNRIRTTRVRGAHAGQTSRSRAQKVHQSNTSILTVIVNVDSLPGGLLERGRREVQLARPKQFGRVGRGRGRRRGTAAGRATAATLHAAGQRGCTE